MKRGGGETKNLILGADGVQGCMLPRSGTGNRGEEGDESYVGDMD